MLAAKVDMTYRPRPSRSNRVDAAPGRNLDNLVFERPSQTVHHGYIGRHITDAVVEFIRKKYVPLLAAA